MTNADDGHFQRKYGRDVVFSSVASAAKALQGFSFLIIISKSLGPENFGIWTQIIATIALLMPLALLQLGAPMSRFLSTETDRKRISAIYFAVVITVTAVSILLSALMFIFASPFAEAFLKGSDSAGFIRWSALLVLLTSMDQVVVQYFWAFRQIRTYAVFATIQVIAEIVLVWLLILSNTSLYGAIAALIIIRLMAFLAGFLFIKRQLVFAMPDFSVLITYLKFGLPLFPYTFCTWTVNNGSRYIIGFFLGAAEVGIFSAAYSLGSIIQLFYLPMVGITLPTTSYLYTNNKTEEIKSIVRYVIKFFIIIAVPVTLLLFVLAKPLLSIMTTSEFVQAYYVIPIIALGYVIYCCSEIFTNLVLVYEGSKPLSIIFTLSTVLNIIISIILVPLLGILGAAISLIVTFVIQFIVIMYRSRKRIHVSIDYKSICRVVLSSLIMTVFVWWQNPSETIAIIFTVVVGIIIYLLCLIVLKEIDPRKIVMIKNLFGKAH